MGIWREAKSTVRTVQKADDGYWYVYRMSIFGNWRLNSQGFKHSTSAWAHLGKLAAKELFLGKK